MDDVLAVELLSHTLGKRNVLYLRPMENISSHEAWISDFHLSS